MSTPVRIPPALEAAASSLRARYAGRHSAETVDSTLVEVYTRLSKSARVQDFVPIFAERAARAHLESAPATNEIKGRPARRRSSNGTSQRRAAAGSE